MNSRSRTLLAAVSVLLAIALASSQGLFYYRDNFATHLPGRYVIGELWSIGELPLWNPWIGGGQPLAGNPNFLAFYPTGALQLVLPFGLAFNLHFWLHLIAAAGGMYAFRAIDGASREEACVAASLYTLSGSVISATAFYNLVTATALVPLALAACALVLRHPSWRSGMILGSVLGLFGLSAEPLITTGTAILLVGFAAGRAARQHLKAFATAGAIAILVALPQLLAFAEIAGEVARTRFGYSTETTVAASMHWWRLPEWLFGPVWGLPTDLGITGWKVAAPETRWPPFLLHFTSTLLIVPALFHAVRSREWRWIAAGAVLLVLALGSSNPLLVAILDTLPSLRIGRFPEKFAIHLSFVGALLVGRWFTAQRHRLDAPITLATTVAVGGAVIAWMIGAGKADAVVEQAFFWIALACTTAIIVIHTPRVMLRIAALLVLPVAAAVVSIPIDRADSYLSRLSDQWPSTRITTTGAIPAPGGVANTREHYRLMATLPVPHLGTTAGVAYALDRSPDGMFSAISRLVQERSHSGDWARLERWAEVNSVSAVVDLSAVYRGGIIRSVDRPLPRLWSPSRVSPAETVQTAVETIESSTFVPGRDAVAPPSVPSSIAPVQVTGVSLLPGRMRVKVAAPEVGVLVTDQTYFSAWSASTSEGQSLRTFPVNLDRLAVAIPPGEHTIELVFGRYRAFIIAAWVVSWTLLVSAVLIAIQLRRSSHGSARPAR